MQDFQHNHLFGLSVTRLWIILTELQRDAVYAVSLICWCWVSLSLENVSQMTSTVAANNFRSLHAEGAVSVSGHCTWNGIEICGPATTALEFVFSLVQRSVAAGAGVNALLGHMLVIFTSKWCLCALLTQDAELFLVQNCLPLL